MLLGIYICLLVMAGLGNLMLWIDKWNPLKTPQANERLHWFILFCILIPVFLPLVIVLILMFANSKPLPKIDEDE